MKNKQNNKEGLKTWLRIFVSRMNSCNWRKERERSLVSALRISMWGGGKAEGGGTEARGQESARNTSCVSMMHNLCLLYIPVACSPEDPCILLKSDPSRWCRYIDSFRTGSGQTGSSQSAAASHNHLSLENIIKCCSMLRNYKRKMYKMWQNVWCLWQNVFTKTKILQKHGIALLLYKKRLSRPRLEAQIMIHIYIYIYIYIYILW